MRLVTALRPIMGNSQINKITGGNHEERREYRRSFMLVTATVMAAIGGFGITKAQAQAWPTRAVTLVVPYAPGASNDTFTPRHRHGLVEKIRPALRRR